MTLKSAPNLNLTSKIQYKNIFWCDLFCSYHFLLNKRGNTSHCWSQEQRDWSVQWQDQWIEFNDRRPHLTNRRITINYWSQEQKSWSTQWQDQREWQLQLNHSMAILQNFNLLLKPRKEKSKTSTARSASYNQQSKPKIVKLNHSMERLLKSFKKNP